MSCFRFGPQGHMVEIPAPSTGMGFDLNRDVTISELVSGERSVYRTPLGFKSFDMSWAGGTNGLGEFMDIFEGAYGNGPFYMYDPRSEGQNLLPARWASCWQLGHVANGWGRPKVSTQAGGTSTPEGKEVLFTGRTNLPIAQADSPFSVLIPIEEGETFNVTAWGAATGGAQLIATPYVGEAPLTAIVVPLNGTPSSNIVANYYGSQMFVKMSLYVPAGATLMLRHMELMAQPTVLRTNRVTNPNVVSGTGWSYWVGSGSPGTGGTASVEPFGGYLDSSFYRLTRTANTVSPSGGIIYNGLNAGTPFTPGLTYTASIYTRPSKLQSLALAFEWKNSSGGAISTAVGTVAVVSAGVWSRVAVTALAPVGAVRAVVTLYGQTGGASWLTGDTLDVDALLVEQGAESTAFFDGSTSAANGKAYRWTGATNNSTSQEYVGDGKQWHMGRGVGAVQFNGNMQGTLTSNKVDRIGLSVGVTEVAS